VANVNKPSLVSPSKDFEQLLLDAFLAAGWKAQSEALISGRRADLLAQKGRHRYVVELKAASEGRRDRLVALLSQAILQAKLYAKDADRAVPLAVVAAPRIPDAVAASLREFALEHAPEVALGLMDREGLRSFSGPGLESLNAEARPAEIGSASLDQGIDLFSDLNQWMLKALLAPHIERAELMPPNFHSEGYRNASELAKAANVSVMSAFRLVRQLDREGFLHESRDRLRLVRIDALLRRWQAANLRPARELNARWILSDAKDPLHRVFERLSGRACLGLFSAARAMGLGHVQGVPPHVYVNEFRSDSMKKAGLMKAEPGERVDVILRLPSARESVFRGIVRVNGLPVSDVLQVWLDVSSHPARGKEQADVIFRRIIKPMIEHVNDFAR
jgi:hypothetical protein